MTRNILPHLEVQSILHCLDNVQLGVVGWLGGRLALAAVILEALGLRRAAGWELYFRQNPFCSEGSLLTYFAGKIGQGAGVDLAGCDLDQAFKGLGQVLRLACREALGELFQDLSLTG